MYVVDLRAQKLHNRECAVCRAMNTDFVVALYHVDDNDEERREVAVYAYCADHELDAQQKERDLKVEYEP
jgi:hypothetical protein